MAIREISQTRVQDLGEIPQAQEVVGSTQDLGLPPPPTPEGQEVQVQFLPAIWGAITAGVSWLVANAPLIVSTYLAGKEAVDQIIEGTETTDETLEAVQNALDQAPVQFDLQPQQDIQRQADLEVKALEAVSNTQELEDGYGFEYSAITIPFNQEVKISWDLVGAAHLAGSGGVAGFRVVNANGETVGGFEEYATGEVGTSSNDDYVNGSSRVQLQAGEYLILTMATDDESKSKVKVTGYQYAEDLPSPGGGVFGLSPLTLIGGAAAVGGLIWFIRQRQRQR